MRRREFIAILGGLTMASVAEPAGARAEQRRARIGALMVIAESDPEASRFVKSNRNTA